MKTMIIIIITSIMMLFMNKNNNVISVKADGFRNNKGQCCACLFNKSDGFPEDDSKAIKCINTKISNKSSVFNFNNLPDGNYAIAIIHDENMNQKFDKNFLGIPKEGYGISNNKLSKLSKPKFEEATFQVNGNKTITINIKY
jgi:uncharacterized protein (DUF2141 family)